MPAFSRSLIRRGAPSPSGKAEVCKTSIPGSNPGGASKPKLLKRLHLQSRNFCCNFAQQCVLARNFGVEVPETFSSAANTPASGSSWLRGLQVRAHTGAIALAPSFSKVAVSVLDVSIRATSCRIDIGGDDLPAVGACRQNLGAAQIQFTDGDMQAIDRAASEIEIHGARYPEHLQKWLEGRHATTETRERRR